MQFERAWTLPEIEQAIDDLEKLEIPSLKAKKFERYSDIRWQAQVAHYLKSAEQRLTNLLERWEVLAAQT